MGREGIGRAAGERVKRVVAGLGRGGRERGAAAATRSSGDGESKWGASRTSERCGH